MFKIDVDFNGELVDLLKEARRKPDAISCFSEKQAGPVVERLLLDMELFGISTKRSVRLVTGG